MFELKFTAKDAVRALWAFAAGAVGYLALYQAKIATGDVDLKPLALGAVVAGLVSIKNLILKDGTVVKG